MSVKQLEVLVAVAATGSVLGAAEQMGVSRGLVRRHLAWLEERTRTALVNRSREGAALTPAGEALAARAKGMVSMASLMLDHAEQVAQIPTGTLKVAAATGPPPQLAALTFQMLAQRMPQVSAELFLVERPLRLLPFAAEMALTFEEETPPNCTAFTVARFPLRLLGSADYLAQHGVPTAPSDLAAHTLAAWRAPQGDPHLWPTSAGTFLKVQPRLVTDDINLLRTAAEQGLGLAFVPDTPGVELVPVMDGYWGGAATMRMVVPDGLADVPRIKTILDAIREGMGT